MNNLFSQSSIKWILLICSLMYMTMAYIPITAKACSCAPPPSVETALSRADAVFSGKVISIKDNRSLSGYTSKKVLFEVSQTWKGVKESQITITTGQGGGDCGNNFFEGEDYLVYSHESDMYGKKQLISTMCDRTVELDSANEDLEILGVGEAPLKQIDLISETQGRSFLIIMFVILLTGLLGFLGWYKFRKS